MYVVLRTAAGILPLAIELAEHFVVTFTSLLTTVMDVVVAAQHLMNLHTTATILGRAS